MALQTAANIIEAFPGNKDDHQEVLHKAALVSASEIQDTTKLSTFFEVAAKNGVVNQDIGSLLLMQVSLKSLASAQCIAILASYSKNHTQLGNQFLTMAQNSDPQSQLVGALCLGSLGKLKDFSGVKNIIELVQSLFGSQHEDVRQAASICLGNLTIGNPQFFLDKVFSFVAKSAAKQKYLFLNTIREIIIHDQKCLGAYIPQLSELLLSHTTSEDEAIRSIVAESLGRLFNYYSLDLLNDYKKGFRGTNNLMKATLARSVKYNSLKTVDEISLNTIAQELIQLAKEEDPVVKKHAFEGLQTLVHNNWVYVRDLLKDMENFAY